MNLPLPLRLLLWPLSVLYGLATSWRAALYAKGILQPKRLNRPVISVGNLTVGGTGKTPMVIWLAQHLMSDRKRVGILSRGYKGNGETSDEIELLKFRLRERPRFGIGPNRYEEGKKLESSVDVFILDDGFQHLQLARDVNVLLIDASQPLGKQTMLPTGRLREPISAMTRADLLIFTRTETVPGTTAAVDKFEDYPVFSARTRLRGFRRFEAAQELLSAAEIGAGPFYAFCGIGNPRAFFQDLKNWNISIAGQSEFRDHHHYDARDVSEIETAAKDVSAKAILTTEKDAQNLTDTKFSHLPAYVVVIDFEISKEEALLGIIREKLESRKFVA
jgi:tetraacyldisaccharide 4'-kinase